jgi:nucleolar MIF4G domain-containing protein 1
MIETLTNLKNNRTKKSEASGADTVERMKKFLAGLSKKYHGTSK